MGCRWSEVRILSPRPVRAPTAHAFGSLVERSDRRSCGCGQRTADGKSSRCARSKPARDHRPRRVDRPSPPISRTRLRSPVGGPRPSFGTRRTCASNPYAANSPCAELAQPTGEARRPRHCIGYRLGRLEHCGRSSPLKQTLPTSRPASAISESDPPCLPNQSSQSS